MMDRLTIPGFGFTADYIASHLQSWPIAQALNRLATYEDTGLSPDEVAALKVKNTRLRAELEAAKRDMRELSERYKICKFCMYDKGGGVSDCKDHKCDSENHYDWRGLCAENGGRMDELISRKALLEAMKQSLAYRMKAQGMDKAVDMVQNAPTIDPVQHARWEMNPKKPYREYKCSDCGSLRKYKTKYCAACGARMDLEGENEKS